MNDLVNLAVGQPSADMLRPDLLAAAARDCFGGMDPEELNYGDYAGDPGFLAALADFLTRHYGAPVAPEELFLTAGASQAIDLACRTWCRPGEAILVEEPSYFLALEIFASHGLRTVPVAMDVHGLRPDALREALAACPEAKLLYTIPLHHNPTSICLTQQRREEMLALTRAHGVTVLADEVYQLLHFAADPPPPPLGLASRAGGVVSVGSFSKILAPAMRVGWIHSDPETVARLSRDGMIMSGGAINHVGSLLVRSALSTGLQEAHLRRVVETLARRARVMHEALAEHMPADVRWERPAGGYFFWLTYPPHVDTAAMLAPARASGTGFHPGIRFSSAGGLHHMLRLSFARYDEKAIARGIARLAEVSRRCLGG